MEFFFTLNDGLYADSKLLADASQTLTDSLIHRANLYRKAAFIRYRVSRRYCKGKITSYIMI